MTVLLTDRQLLEHIMALKDNIDAFDFANQRKLVFFNAFCFYEHLLRLPWVAGLLDAVEPYIPLSLSPASLELFIHTARSLDDREERGGNYLEACAEERADFFMLQARVDFIDSLQKADTPERWSRLVGVCGAIRDIKEQLLLLAR